MSEPESLRVLDMRKLIERFNNLSKNIRNCIIKDNPSIFGDEKILIEALSKHEKTSRFTPKMFKKKIGGQIRNAHIKEAFNEKDMIITLLLKTNKEGGISIPGYGYYPVTEDLAKEDIDFIIRSSFENFQNIKLRLRKEILYKQNGHFDDLEEIRTTWMSTTMQVVHPNNYDMDTEFDKLKNIGYIDGRETTSKIVYLAIKSIVVEIHDYQPLNAGSYFSLPEVIQNKKACINVKNNDNKCFLWSIIAKLHPADKNAERVSKYQNYESQYNMNGIDYPVKIKDIERFEKHNNISVNVFGLEDNNRVYPLWITKNQENETLIELLLISNESTQHYVLIKDFNRLMSDINKHKGRKFFCKYCLHPYSSERLLIEHKGNCGQIQKIIYPEEGNTLEFKNYYNKLPVPFVIYCDFESILKKSDDVLHNHECCGFGYKVVCRDDPRRTKQTVIYRGKDAAFMFIQEMIEERKNIIAIMKNTNEPIIMTSSDRTNFRGATHCHICSRDFVRQSKVPDHCHFTGKFRGAAHSRCNLDYNKVNDNKLFIPVVFHNLKGYDSHFIIKELYRFAIDEKDKMEISIIPNNMEKFISFSLFTRHKLRFIDSYAFMASSLSKLVNNLEDNDFDYLVKEFNHVDLLKSKGIYPYEYMDSFARFDETNLPSKENFYSALSGENITDKEYSHALDVFNSYNCKNLGDYHDLYLKSDVLLLTCVFEKFRTVCLDNYGLDCCAYYTSPGLSWDAMLKMTEVKLDLISDPDMFLFFEKGIRGGVSTITRRYAKANNKYLKDYNDKQPSTFVSYLDANNLYGWAMSQELPISNFEWCSEEEYYKDRDVEGIGFALEVDLEYPIELHKMHNEYPLAPERLKVNEAMLSDYSKKFGVTHFTEKLIPNLYDKEKYILHYKNLELYLSLGLKLSKIHRVIKFKESKWLEKYISFNTEKRRLAANEFEKGFYKMMNNSVFGKTMENLRKRTQVELTTNEIRRNKLVNKPNFKRMEIYQDNYVGVELGVQSIQMLKPTYCGFSILDLSKCLMYDFHYNKIKKDFPGKKSALLMTDTDSLCYEIKTGDIYDYYKNNKFYFDLSEFERADVCDNTNKKVIGKFKDESPNKQIIRFCGLRSKVYALKFEDNEIKKCKGINKNVVKRDIVYSDYKRVLKSSINSEVSIVNIQSKSHEVKTVKQQKIALSSYDDKRFIHDNAISSFAYGNYNIFL